MSDGLDPEIAALLAQSAESAPADGDTVLDFESPSDNPISFSSGSGSAKSIHEVDLSRKEFAPIEKFTSDTPSEVFNDTKYYKTALTGENQSAQRVHQILSKYLTCQDPKDRAVYRQQIVTSYWELLRGMVGKMGFLETPMPKKMLVRFGVLLPSLFKQETKDLLALINNSDNECYDSIAKKLTREPLYLTVLKAVDGRFGKRVLNPQYRRWWRVMTYGALAFLFFRFVVCPFFDWWDGVVRFLNYVIWG